MIRFRHALLFFAALAVVGFAWAAFANLIQNRPTGETVFDNGGAPWPFFSQVAVINYDKGGQGVGYNVPFPDPTDCPDGASYRPDAVNFKTSIAGAPAIPFQIGCGLIGNSWNYTVNISQSGPYQITLQLGDASLGGSWNILIDGVQVATVSTPNTGSYDTFGGSTSGPFTATLGNHKLTIAGATGDTQFGVAGDILTWQGSKAAAATINSVAMSCGSGCGFVGGTAGTVGTAQATMSSGSFAGTWSLRTSGTDNFGATCNNYGAGFVINSSTGVLTNGAIANGSYPGVCLVATQAGAGGSPFAQAVSITGAASGIPAPAVAAGFTSQALNADFSQSTYSNTATWIDGCGAPASGFRWIFRWYGQGGTPPCARIDTENDGTINKQVLHLQFQVGDMPTSGYMSLNYPQTPFTDNNNYFPLEYYVEITFRIASASLTQAHGGTDVFNFFGTTGPNHNSWIEPDFLEVQSNTNNGSGWIYGDGIVEWCGGVAGCGGCFQAICNPGGLPRADVSAYHTIGNLFTGDNVSQYWKCFYFDGNDLGCGGGGLANPSAVISQHDNIMTMLWGTQDTNGLPLSQNVDLYIQSIHVWTCPGAFGTSTQCAGPVITQ